MSADYKTTVIVGAQINRGVGERSDKRPTMSDIKDSGSVEQDADLILTLYRDEYYDEATEDRGVTEIGIAKNRDGRVGTIRLLHDLKFGHYLDCISKPLDF
jgi:replicative DNA helicase